MPPTPSCELPTFVVADAMVGASDEHARMDIRYYTHLAEGMAIPIVMGEAVREACGCEVRAAMIARQQVSPSSRAQGGQM